MVSFDALESVYHNWAKWSRRRNVIFVMAARRAEMSAAGEMIGIAGLAIVVPALVSIAFVPMDCIALSGVMKAPARLNIRRLGMIELGLTALFAAFVLFAYR